MTLSESAGRGPDFICIGQQRAGTTWLYRHLGLHPDIVMPPIKELHFFDWGDSRPRFQIGRESIRFYLEHDRRLRAAKALLTRPASWRHLGWLLAFARLGADERRYVSLFPVQRDKLAGDVTPNYAWLSDARVRRVAALVPRARILFVIRNPIGRSWSTLRFRVAYGGGNPRKADEDTLLRYAREMERVLKGRVEYDIIADRWIGAFGGDRFHLGFHEDLVARPETFLNGIFDFLGLAPLSEFPPTLSRPVNARVDRPMPPAVRRHLGRLHLEDAERIHRRFDNARTAAWLAECRDAAG